jgi:ADP-ribose pyrophosphatase YjhB (NUDIX family)
MSDMRRFPSRPFLGVGALILDGMRILLVERGQAPLAGAWSLPGGIVEAGERLEDAVIREVLEETGLRVSPIGIATVFERIMPGAGGTCEYHYVVVDFYCSVQGGDLQAGSDSKQAAWWEIDKLEEFTLTPGTLAVIEACRNGCAPLPVVSRP